MAAEELGSNLVTRSGIPFSRRLRQNPVLVEVIPPRVGASPAQIDQALELVGHLLDQTRPDAVNVPEIIGSAFQSMDALDFGTRIHDRFLVDVVVNKVVVHQPRDAFQAWADRVVASDLASVILVGGERSGIYYPGPSVREANQIMRERAIDGGRTDLPVGNVSIPSRPNEAVRMLEKARHGCDYFTSQIVYDFPSANAHLQAFDDVCQLGGLSPPPVLYAFSPVETQQDILFLRYLGVNIPPDVERDLLAPNGKPAGASLRIIESLWTRLLEAAKARDVRVPLGVIAETVFRHNVGAVADLVNILRSGLTGAENPGPASARIPA